MTEHFTKNTVEASAWCPKGQKRTQHRVDKGLVGPCLVCIAKYDAARQGTRCERCYFLGVPCAGLGRCGCACHNAIDLDELREKLSPRQAGLFGDAT